jgi:PadR family transcriptional regulator PadR
VGTEYLGEFEQLVLLAIVRLGEHAYGVTIRRTIEERAERGVSFGAVYSTLRRLESKQYVSSGSPEPADPGAAGRPKKFFEITDQGLEALHSAQRRIQRMAEGVSALGNSA